jgi:hypothetical protein
VTNGHGCAPRSSLLQRPGRSCRAASSLATPPLCSAGGRGGRGGRGAARIDDLLSPASGRALRPAPSRPLTRMRALPRAPTAVSTTLPPGPGTAQKNRQAKQPCPLARPLGGRQHMPTPEPNARALTHRCTNPGSHVLSRILHLCSFVLVLTCTREDLTHPRSNLRHISACVHIGTRITVDPCSLALLSHSK